MALPTSIWIKFTATDDPINPRDSRIPLFIEIPFDDNNFVEFGLNWGTTVSITISLTPSSTSILTVDINGELPQSEFSLSWDSNTNIGTTDCPFVEWIGELSTTEVFDTPIEYVWTPPANIDTTKPVIVEAWGSGANGLVDAQLGGSGGGGGAYAASDVVAVLGQLSKVSVSAVAGTNSYISDTEENVVPVVAALAVMSDGGTAANSIGDVKFSGGDGAVHGDYWGGGGGGSAWPYTDGGDGSDDSHGAGFGNGGDAGYSTPASNGSIPGGGGGGGALEAYASPVAGLGSRGEVRIHYRLQAEIPTPEPAIIVPQEGSRKTINIPGQTQIINGKVIVDGVELTPQEAIDQTGGQIKRLGGGAGGVSTAGPKFGSQEFLEVPRTNLE